MDDLISRQTAITQLSHNKNKGDDEWELAVENDIQTIWKLPLAQPEIIYCKDCKYSEYHKLYGDRFCQYNNVVNVVPDLHYCGYAERRTDVWEEVKK